jgi:hypothetical protein
MRLFYHCEQHSLLLLLYHTVDIACISWRSIDNLQHRFTTSLDRICAQCADHDMMTCGAVQLW